MDKEERKKLVYKRKLKNKYKKLMDIEKYNISIAGKSLNFLTKEEIAEIKENKKTRETRLIRVGWQISKIDLMAITDFLIDRKCRKKDVLTYAIRYSIPYKIYDNIINKRNEQHDISNIEKNKICSQYKEWVLKNRIDIPEEDKTVMMNYSWDIYDIDYNAIMVFKSFTNMSAREIIENALRTYLTQRNYEHAIDLVSRLKRYRDENIEDMTKITADILNLEEFTDEFKQL